MRGLYRNNDPAFKRIGMGPKRVNSGKTKKKPIFPILLEGEEPWLSVESVQYVEIVNNTLPAPKFYAAVAKVLPRHISQSKEPFYQVVLLNSDGKFERKPEVHEA